MEKLISDMYLAAAVLAYGGKLERVDRTNPSRQQFVFSGDIELIYIEDQNNIAKLLNPSIEDIETKFISQSLVFPPNYPDMLRRIKSAIHAR